MSQEFKAINDTVTFTISLYAVNTHIYTHMNSNKVIGLTFEAIVTNKLAKNLITVNCARPSQSGAYNLQLISACTRRVRLHKTIGCADT